MSLKEKHLKMVNQKLGWVYGKSPGKNKSHFVATKSGDVFIAVADKHAANGWSNMDTWEDFENMIVAYQLVPMPLYKV